MSAGQRTHRTLGLMALALLAAGLLAACAPEQAPAAWEAAPAAQAATPAAPGVAPATLVAALQAQPTAAATEVRTAAAVGQRAPAFSVVTLDGKPLRSAELLGEGKPLILYFFATW